MDDLRFYIEAILFASPTPLSELRITELLEQGVGAKTNRGEVPSIIDALNKHYEESSSSFRIKKWGGGFQFATVRDADDAIRPLFVDQGEKRMTRALIESLAIVAYKQPVTKPELDNIRGVDSTYGVRKLLDSGFITICGRGEGVGQPLLYGTTQRFLEEFGISGIEELPKMKEVEDILRDPEFTEHAATIQETMTELEEDQSDPMTSGLEVDPSGNLIEEDELESKKEGIGLADEDSEQQVQLDEPDQLENPDQPSDEA